VAKSSADGTLAERFRRSLFRSISLSPANFLPECLYHYTTAPGLAGILNSRSIRATNFSFLNDPSEIEYGRDLAINVIAHARKTASRHDQEFFERSMFVVLLPSRMISVSGEHTVRHRLNDTQSVSIPRYFKQLVSSEMELSSLVSITTRQNRSKGSTSSSARPSRFSERRSCKKRNKLN